jgi:hypothetical protein
MKIRTSRLCVQTSVWVLASAFCVTSLIGCGANGNFTEGLGPDTAVEGLSGTVHGGPNPVTNATVTLYATSTVASPTSSNGYGYGQAGVSLGTATTNASGNFSFSGTETACPAGQQAYIVSSGGYTGSNSASNTASLLMAALGPCSGITEGASGTHVVINELTTIASAYALSGFMSVSGTTVKISAPTNNNAATPACTTSGTSPHVITTACSASGLAHAFLNAANLVNTNTGIANSTFTSGSTVTVAVPQMLINTLGNTVEACVNSASNTSTACKSLMTNTTPSELTSPTAPVNTLQALLDLAQYPSMANGCPTAGNTPPVLCAAGAGSGPPLGSTAGDAVPSAATTALFNLANSNAYYAPALTASPLDFTIAINYSLAPSGSAVNVWGLGTDIKDNLYAYTNSSGAPETIYSLASNGALNWEKPTGTTCGFSTTGSRCVATTDTLGNVWVTDNSGLTEMNASTGTVGTTYTTVDSLHKATVDVGNNVWLAAYNLGTANGTQAHPSALEELVQGATAISDITVGSGPETATASLHDLSFDTAGNLWSASDAAGGGGLGAILMISSNNSLTSPAFTFTTTSNPQLYLGGAGSHSWAPMIDISGNAWIGSESELNEVTSSGSESGGAVNYATSFSTIYGPTWESGVERNNIEDGDGKFVVAAASTGAGYISVYYPNAPSDGDAGTGLGGADVYLNPCYVSSGTTCSALTGGQSEATNVTRGLAVDSTGAIWGGFAAASDLIQILGPGAPSWSQQSWVPAAYKTNTSGRPY